MTSHHDVMAFMFRINSIICSLISFKVSVLVIMCEKELDTCCLLRWTVLKLIQKVSFSSPKARLITLCWTCLRTVDLNRQFMYPLCLLYFLSASLFKVHQSRSKFVYMSWLLLGVSSGYGSIVVLGSLRVKPVHTLPSNDFLIQV